MVEIATILKGCTNKGSNVTEVPTRDSISSANSPALCGIGIFGMHSPLAGVFFVLFLLFNRQIFWESKSQSPSLPSVQLFNYNTRTRILQNDSQTLRIRCFEEKASTNMPKWHHPLRSNYGEEFASCLRGWWFFFSSDHILFSLTFFCRNFRRFCIRTCWRSPNLSFYILPFRWKVLIELKKFAPTNQLRRLDVDLHLVITSSYTLICYEMLDMPSFSFQYEVGPVCWALCKALRFGVDLGMRQSATRCLFLDIDANVMATSQRPQTKSPSKTFWKNQQVGLSFRSKVFVEPIVVALFSPLMAADSKSWRIRFLLFHDLSTQVESDFTPLSLCQDHWQLCFRWRCFRPKQLLWYTRLSQLDPGGCETLPGSDRFRGCLWGKTARLCVDAELPTCFAHVLWRWVWI